MALERARDMPRALSETRPMNQAIDCVAGATSGRLNVCVLLVGHDDRPRQSLTEALTETGCHVLSAANGEYALRVIDRESVDIVLTDIVMPEMDGLEMIRHLGKIRPELPVIAMSDYAEPSVTYLRFAVSLGAAEILRKPFEIDAALDMIHRHAIPG